MSRLVCCTSKVQLLYCSHRPTLPSRPSGRQRRPSKLMVTDIALALFSVPLVTNLVITSLIIWRIKQAQNSSKFVANHKLNALYPFFLVVTLILYCLNNNGQDIVSLYPSERSGISHHVPTPCLLPTSDTRRWLRSPPPTERARSCYPGKHPYKPWRLQKPPVFPHRLKSLSVLPAPSL
jgi:hypothetical protein